MNVEGRTSDPIFTVGIVGRCSEKTLQEIEDFLEMLDGFQKIYKKVTKGRLWLRETL